MDAFAFSLRQMLGGAVWLPGSAWAALRGEALGSARARLFAALAEPLFSALAARAYFLLLRQKKVAKEKATPGSAPAARVPCATRFERGLRNSGYALRQSSPSFRSNLRCSAPLRGTPKASRNDGSALEKGKTLFFSGRPLKTTQNHLYRFGGDAFRVPLRGAEQRRLAGGFGLRLSEPQASLASRPASRVAQGTGQRPAPTRGSPFLCLLSFGEAKESETPRKGGTITQNEHNIPRSRDQSERRNPRVKQHNIPIAIRR